MNFRRLLTLAILGGFVSLASVAATPVAHAQDEEDPEPEVSDEGPSVWDGLLAVQATGGYDTPFGVAGAAIELSPQPWLTIYAGGGIGRAGGRFAGGLLLQAPIDHAAFGLQVGLGGGSLEDTSDGAPGARIRRYWGMALYFHAGLDFTYRFDMGLFARLSFGVNAMVAGEADECTFEATQAACGVSASGLNKPTLPFAGLSVGYALDL